MNKEYTEGYRDGFKDGFQAGSNSDKILIVNDGEPRKGMSSMSIQMKKLMDKDYAKEDRSVIE